MHLQPEQRSRSPLRAWWSYPPALCAQRGDLLAFEVQYRDVAPLIARHVRRRVVDRCELKCAYVAATLTCRLA
ncbi:MAG: hypothetical protein AAGJ56_02075, partial [Myxococcota bacterium]